MRADELLQTHTQRCGNTVLLRLTGELDIATAPLIHQALTTALAPHPQRLHLDLTALTFCDGTGLRALQHLIHTLHATDTTLHLTGLHPNLRRTLHLLKPHPLDLPLFCTDTCPPGKGHGHSPCSGTNEPPGGGYPACR
ncbi:STAS domain-containing protein [Streptomyces sp. NPDC056470]|uniref:STAS domain-containing protein n=1 Tax=Streptomyces sp. NPDC056470 TaxID=3345831 RepID=UPI0036B72B9D